MKLLFCSLLFIIVGVICIARGVLNRNLKNRKALIWIGIGFAVVGAVTLAVMCLFDEDRVLFAWAICMSGILFITAGYLTRIVFQCNEMILGRYAGCNRYAGSHGVVHYSPVFAYEYRGIFYEEQTAQSFPARYIKQNFTEGAYYWIYIDPKRPDRFICEKKPNILLWVLGIVFLAAALVFL